MTDREYQLIVVRSARKEMLSLPPKAGEQGQRAIEAVERTMDHRPEDRPPAILGSVQD